jgi:hypothetical protein
MDKILKTILKRQMLKYPRMIQRSMAELQVVS